jgi:hypothetical protein
MKNPWGDREPLPDAVADPIIPEESIPKLTPVTSPYLKEYRIVTNQELRANPEIGKMAIKVRDMYVTNPKSDQKVTVGTLIPLAIQGQDFLAVIQWHTNHDPRGLPGVEIWAPRTGKHVAMIVKDLIGRWLVSFDTGWSWYYTFSQANVATWTDIKDPPELKGQGTWSLNDRSVKITWENSSEEWLRPLKTWTAISFFTVGGVCVTRIGGQRGQSLVGDGGLSAEKLSG